MELDSGVGVVGSVGGNVHVEPRVAGAGVEDSEVAAACGDPIVIAVATLGYSGEVAADRITVIAIFFFPIDVGSGLTGGLDGEVAAREDIGGRRPVLFVLPVV